MTTIGTRQLRAALAGFVRRASAGERFVITVDNRAVAQLVPVADGSPGGPETLEDAARLGRIERPLAGGSRVRTPGASSTSQLGDTPIPADVRVDRILRQVRG